MHESACFVDRVSSRDERLPRHLAAEDTLAILVECVPAEHVDLDYLEIEQVDEVIEGGLAALHGGRHIAT